VSARKQELEELRGKAAGDLEKELDTLREELFRLRYGAVAESLENTKEIRAKRKRIARINTLIAAGASAPAATPATNEG